MLRYQAAGEVWRAAPQRPGATGAVVLRLTRLPRGLGAAEAPQPLAPWPVAHRPGHPNILPLLETFVLDLGGPCCLVSVSEYLPDGSLQDWLARRGGAVPSLEITVALMDGILRGLEYGHHRQPAIIHGSLQPSNVLLQGATPRLAEGGLATLLRDLAQADEVSAPDYLAPEAWDGVRTVATDIWAAGGICYLLLAGRPPFRRSTRRETLRALFTQEPAPLPASVLAGLRALVTRALHKEPGQRFGTAAEMRRAMWEAAGPAVSGAATQPRAQIAPFSTVTGRLRPHPALPCPAEPSPGAYLVEPSPTRRHFSLEEAPRLSFRGRLVKDLRHHLVSLQDYLSRLPAQASRLMR